MDFKTASIRRFLSGSSLLLGLTSCFLVGACGTEPPPTPAALVAKDPREIPEPVAVRGPTTVHVELSVRERIGELAPGVKTAVWTFNGTVPGPLIRVREGDTVELALTNEPNNLEPHDIDLHALEGPGGGAVATEVKPGETREVRFQPQRPGAYLYHCSAEGKPWEHLTHGMYGVILVEPAGGLAPVDLEAYVVQSEWYLAQHLHGAAVEEEEEGQAAEGEHEGEGEQDVPDDVMVMNDDAARRAEPTLFTFNGHRSALTASELYGDRLQIPAGGRVRFFFGNAGPNLASNFHVMGGIFDRVYTGPFDQPLIAEETVAVPPGSAAVFEMNVPEVAEYGFVDHALFHAEQGAMGVLHVRTPSDSD